MECPLSRIPKNNKTHVTYTFDLRNVDLQHKDSFSIDSKLITKCNGILKVSSINTMVVNLHYKTGLECKDSNQSLE